MTRAPAWSCTIPPRLNRGVELRARPLLVEDGTTYAAVLRRIAVRYLGESNGGAYANTAGERGLVIRLEPGQLRAWDFADDFVG